SLSSSRSAGRTPRRPPTGTGSCRAGDWRRCPVDHLAVEDVRDAVAGADALQPVPLADRPLHVLAAAEALDVLPQRVAGVPVDPPRRELLRRRPRTVIILFVPLLALADRPLLRLDGQGAILRLAQDEEVAGAALDHLALVGLHPRPEAAVGAGAVQQ